MRLEDENRVEASETISVAAVRCVTPEGRLLFNGLTFRVDRGDSMLIMGPSGSGKSSLLRIIAGLWPVDSGTIRRPLHIGRNGLFFVPQRPYITQGSLRTQILYPDTVDSQCKTDDELKVGGVGLCALLAHRASV